MNPYDPFDLHHHYHHHRYYYGDGKRPKQIVTKIRLELFRLLRSNNNHRYRRLDGYGHSDCHDLEKFQSTNDSKDIDTDDLDVLDSRSKFYDAIERRSVDRSKIVNTTIENNLNEIDENDAIDLERDHRYRIEMNLSYLLDLLRIYLCGNFYYGSLREVQNEEENRFVLEREILDKNLYGYFIFNLEQFDRKILQNFSIISNHLMMKYSYRTRKPLIERLRTKDSILIERLFYLLLHRPDVAYFVSKILTTIIKQKSLAFKLIDMNLASFDDAYNQNQFDADNQRSRFNYNEPIYLDLLRALPRINDFNHLVQLLKIIEKIFLIHIELANYVFNRDLYELIEIFNNLIQSKCYYLRLLSLRLFGKLLQNRSLQKLIQFYTKNLTYFELIFTRINDADRFNRREEFATIFEILRLFLLNPLADSNLEMKQFLQANYMQLHRIILKAQQIRSYTDLALFQPEYQDVIHRLNKLTDQINSSDGVNDQDDDLETLIL
ncbi:hypothetical protein SSS_00469 [Sarcoptes scabiei]|uniref:Uncharacterized protein n=1 Tax=Sarcoptes scabiei TaxID=52283 RepID=A0A834VCK5_SARSC|nr:hypothetical protein SSS_00469 [Sarcoptes scabiei]